MRQVRYESACASDRSRVRTEKSIAALEVKTKGRRAELAFLRTEVDQTRTELQRASQALETARAQNRVHASLLAERQVRARCSVGVESGVSTTPSFCLLSITHVSPAPCAFRARSPSRTRRTRSF